ncbi:MAG: putative transrane, partial [Myxococcaceae bacterium]|nr:putative transrane [Myxococcaceae bacterium]
HEEQEIVATIRETPFAARLEFVRGPGKGRRVLYNSTLRKREFRVREAGFLSIFGGLWIDVDNRMAKKESNHSPMEAGLGNLLRRFKKDLDRATPMGGFGVKHEGWDAKGNFCSIWTSPNQGAGFDSATTRICTDLKSGLPSKVEAFDAKGGMIETYEFFDAKAVTLSDAFLKPEGL